MCVFVTLCVRLLITIDNTLYIAIVFFTLSGYATSNGMYSRGEWRCFVGIYEQLMAWIRLFPNGSAHAMIASCLELYEKGEVEHMTRWNLRTCSNTITICETGPSEI